MSTKRYRPHGGQRAANCVIILRRQGEDVIDWLASHIGNQWDTNDELRAEVARLKRRLTRLECKPNAQSEPRRGQTL
jgi:hypothetical protein